MRTLLPMLLGAALAASYGTAAASSIDALRWQRRVVLLSAQAASDPRLLAQRRTLAAWQQGAHERDVTIVLVVGSAVEGADETSDALRMRFALPPDRFSVVLIGKDGHVAVRSGEPVDGAYLARTIDAMPMRRAGQR